VLGQGMRGRFVRFGATRAENPVVGDPNSVPRSAAATRMIDRDAPRPRTEGTNPMKRASRSTRRTALIVGLLAVLLVATGCDIPTPADDPAGPGMATIPGARVDIDHDTLRANDEVKECSKQYSSIPGLDFCVAWETHRSADDGDSVVLLDGPVADGSTCLALGCGAYEFATDPKTGKETASFVLQVHPCTATCATDHGTVSPCSEGACISYVPDGSFIGTDTFTYLLCTGGNCSPATASVLVGPGTLRTEMDVTAASLEGAATMTKRWVLQNDWIGAKAAKANSYAKTDVKLEPTTFQLVGAAKGVASYDERSTSISYQAPDETSPTAVPTIGSDLIGYRVCHNGATSGTYCALGTIWVNYWRFPSTQSTTTTPTTGRPRPSDSGPGAPADSDGDGVADSTDNCVNVANPLQTNTDGANDGGNDCDTDDDNDAVLDGADNCPTNTNALQTNTDGAADGGDACDTDDDDDGRSDATDAFPLDFFEQDDADTDGMGDNNVDPCPGDANQDCIATNVTTTGNSWIPAFGNYNAQSWGANKVRINATNNDGIDHDFWIDMDTSGTVNAGDIFQTITAGATNFKFTITIANGNYTISCPDGGHAPMLKTLMVA
jgi:hypothetical protein